MTMSYALADIDYLSSDKLLAGIVDNILTDSELLQSLKFKPLTNKALDYNRELTNPTATMHARGDDWESSSLTFTPVSVSLKILGAQVDILNSDIRTRSDTNDPVAIALAKASKSMQRKFEQMAIYGNATTYPTDFNGLHALVSTSDPDMDLFVGATASTRGTLTLRAMYEFVDMVLPGKPDAIIMNRAGRRLLSVWTQGATSNLYKDTINALGRPVRTWDDIPIIICDHITNTETVAGSTFAQATGYTACTSMFALKFGEENNGIVGLDAKGGMEVQNDVGGKVLANKDAIRKRLVWETALALYGNYSLARLCGIDTSAAMTA